MIETAIKASEEAARILKAGFGSKIDRVYKEDLSTVTVFDHQAEEAIIKIIKADFPDHNIIAEESGEEPQGHNFTWVIDPLDGTGNFSKGIPLFAVAIACVKDREIVTAVINEPLSESVFTTEVGKGAQMNGKKISVSECAELSKSVVSFARGRKREFKGKFKTIFSLLGDKIKTPRIFGSTVWEMAAVANGTTDAMVVYGAYPWDVYSGILLIREAGGRVTDFSGKDWEIGSQEYIASNGKIHEELVEILKEKIKTSNT